MTKIGKSTFGNAIELLPGSAYYVLSFPVVCMLFHFKRYLLKYLYTSEVDWHPKYAPDVTVCCQPRSSHSQPDTGWARKPIALVTNSFVLSLTIYNRRQVQRTPRYFRSVAPAAAETLLLLGWHLTFTWSSSPPFPSPRRRPLTETTPTIESIRPGAVAGTPSLPLLQLLNLFPSEAKLSSATINFGTFLSAVEVGNPSCTRPFLNAKQM